MTASPKQSGSHGFTHTRRLIFWLIALAPLAAIALVLWLLLARTDFARKVYDAAVVNIYFDCVEFSDADYVYRMKSGRCTLDNLEYRTVLNHDPDGFRNPPARPGAGFDVVVLGDSHAHGFGVGDTETFAHLLGSVHGLRTYNLGVGSYATQRELSVLRAFTKNEKAIVLQYCDNDYNENLAALRLSPADFHRGVETGWKAIAESYRDNKARGALFPLKTAARVLLRREFQTVGARQAQDDARDLDAEAAAFAAIVAANRDLLAGKRLVVFESSGHGRNSPRFQKAFDAALRQQAPGLDVLVLDSSRFLSPVHYFGLDEHLNSAGHREVAVQLAIALKQQVR
jgi:hypothetical protein